MREEYYHPSISGEVRFSDNGGYSYFWPNDLPFDIQLDKKIYKKVETATIALSKLDGKVSQMTELERNILLVPFALMESTESSSIEGTGTTIEDLYRSERIEETDQRKFLDDKEVLNYKHALNYALSIKGENINEQLLLKLHSILMDGIRGKDKSPGEYRNVQVLVGNRGDTFDTVRFVPMPPEWVGLKMDRLLEYLNAPDENVLVSAALSHYQFETIRPFTDGNGRMGRLLIMLILNKGGVLEYPVLYLSKYFNDRRDEYLDKLSKVHETDDFQGWLDLFLEALIEQSQRSMALIDHLYRVRQKYHGITADPKTLRLLDSLFVNPYVRKTDAATICDVHPSTAGRIVDGLAKKGILRETTGRKRNQLYVCDEIMDLLRSYRNLVPRNVPAMLFLMCWRSQKCRRR